MPTYQICRSHRDDPREGCNLSVTDSLSLCACGLCSTTQLKHLLAFPHPATLPYLAEFRRSRPRQPLRRGISNHTRHSGSPLQGGHAAKKWMSERYYQGQKLQRIAVKVLLYRLRLPGTYESRMHSVQCSFNLSSARYHRVGSDRRKSGCYSDPIVLLRDEKAAE